MRIANEAFLAVFVLIPVFAGVFWYGLWRRREMLGRLGNVEMLQMMMTNFSSGRRLVKMLLVLGAVVFMVLAGARPQWGQKEDQLVRRGRDVFVAVDTSLSMLAEDIQPNRIREAKRRIRQLSQIAEGDRLGLIIFAGQAFVQCPLTLDYGGFRMALEAVDVGILPQEGTNINAAIEFALGSFVEGERKHKVLILITDGENWEGNPLEIAERAAEEGVKIYCVGIGGPEGVPIPKYDENGNRQGYYTQRGSEEPVLTRLDENTLQKIALETGGAYYRAASATGIEIERIYDDIREMEAREIEGEKLILYEDRFVWFLLPGFLLLLGEFLLSERRRDRREVTALPARDSA